MIPFSAFAGVCGGHRRRRHLYPALGSRHARDGVSHKRGALGLVDFLGFEKFGMAGTKKQQQQQSKLTRKVRKSGARKHRPNVAPDPWSDGPPQYDPGSALRVAVLGPTVHEISHKSIVAIAPINNGSVSPNPIRTMTKRNL